MLVTDKFNPKRIMVWLYAEKIYVVWRTTVFNMN